MVNNFLEWKTNSARGESIYPRLCLFLFFPVDLLLSSKSKWKWSMGIIWTSLRHCYKILCVFKLNVICTNPELNCDLRSAIRGSGAQKID